MRNYIKVNSITKVLEYYNNTEYHFNTDQLNFSENFFEYYYVHRLNKITGVEAKIIFPEEENWRKLNQRKIKKEEIVF